MSSAVNLFLHQSVLRGGLPFNVEMPRYSQHTLDAMNEARRISRDPDVKGYPNMDELKNALEKISVYSKIYHRLYDFPYLNSVLIA